MCKRTKYLEDTGTKEITIRGQGIREGNWNERLLRAREQDLAETQTKGRLAVSGQCIRKGNKNQQTI